MRKLLVVLLLALLPLQFTWAAIGNYCKHENGSEASHVGHHVHKHASQSTGSESTELEKAGTVDPDCGTCHSNCSTVLFQSSFALKPTHFLDFEVMGQLPKDSRPPDTPERPQWSYTS